MQFGCTDVRKTPENLESLSHCVSIETCAARRLYIQVQKLYVPWLWANHELCKRIWNCTVQLTGTVQVVWYFYHLQDLSRILVPHLVGCQSFEHDVTFERKGHQD